MWSTARHSRAVIGGAVAALLGGALALTLMLLQPDATTGDAGAWSGGGGGRAGPPAQRQPAATAAPARGPARTPASAVRSAAPAPVAAAPVLVDRTAAPALGIPLGDARPAPVSFQDAGMALPPWSGNGGVPAPAPIPFPGGGGGGGSGVPAPVSAAPGDGVGLPFWPVPFFPFPLPGGPVEGGGPIILLPWPGGPTASLPGGSSAIGLGPAAPPVPEPSTWALLASGLLALGAALHRGRGLRQADAEMPPGRAPD
jgi:hypothetical protein